MPETPSVVELLERLAQRDELIEALSAELDAARGRIAELEARLGQTSKNSSKPPSSDGLAKPAPKSLRQRSARKPGGQAGHPGSTLAPVAVSDEVIGHEPECCRGCGDDLSGAPDVGRERRQVFDILPISVRVIEHQLVKRRCPCGRATSADAPEGVSAPVQYGLWITAITVYLYGGQFLSKKRTAAALTELFGTPVSEGTVATMTTRAANGLGGFLEWVRTTLAAAQVVNVDETGLRVEGRLRWVHSASTGKYRLIFVRDRRGTKAMDAAGVLPYVAGVAVHDARGRPMTPTPRSRTPCVTRTSCGSSRPSPTPPQQASGAGRSRPPTRCAR